MYMQINMRNVSREQRLGMSRFYQFAGRWHGKAGYESIKSSQIEEVHMFSKWRVLFCGDTSIQQTCFFHN